MTNYGRALFKLSGFILGAKHYSELISFLNFNLGKSDIFMQSIDSSFNSVNSISILDINIALIMFPKRSLENILFLLCFFFFFLLLLLRSSVDCGRPYSDCIVDYYYYYYYYYYYSLFCKCDFSKMAG
jgi:hypothetical protein